MFISIIKNKLGYKVNGMKISATSASEALGKYLSVSQAGSVAIR